MVRNLSGYVLQVIYNASNQYIEQEFLLYLNPKMTYNTNPIEFISDANSYGLHLSELGRGCSWLNEPSDSPP